jgi:hypothetical protein
MMSWENSGRPILLVMLYPVECCDWLELSAVSFLKIGA